MALHCLAVAQDQTQGGSRDGAMDISVILVTLQNLLEAPKQPRCERGETYTRRQRWQEEGCLSSYQVFTSEESTSFGLPVGNSSMS